MTHNSIPNAKRRVVLVLQYVVVIISVASLNRETKNETIEMQIIGG